MIEIHLKYDNMHIFGMINVFICINNHANSCINSMLSGSRRAGARAAGHGQQGAAAARGWAMTVRHKAALAMVMLAEMASAVSWLRQGVTAVVMMMAVATTAAAAVTTVGLLPQPSSNNHSSESSLLFFLKWRPRGSLLLL